MVRYIIAAVLGCLYVAGSIWVVRSEGQAYRDGLSKPRLAARVIEKSPAPSPAEKDRTAAVVTALELTPSRPEPAAAKPAPATIADSSAKPAAKPAPPMQPLIELAKAKPATSPSADRAPGRAAGAVTAPANPLANDSFWSQPQLTRAWDLADLKTDNELRLGAELHDLIVQLNPLVEDGPWLSRVEDAAEPFLKTLRRKEINYKFFILNSDAVNAFSTPGGYVYVSRGLFDLIGEDEDDALQFAIGHEIAHVDLQHAIRCLQDPGVKRMTEGTLQKLYWLIIPFGYLVSDKVDQEFDADEWVLNRMQGFGRTRRETLVFLQKLDGYAKKHGFANGRAKPQPGRDTSPLENHYRSQTAAWRRLKNLKQRMDQIAKVPN
jgi:Peptidase family M48